MEINTYKNPQIAIEESKVLGKIENITVYGRGGMDRGQPKRVEVAEIKAYSNKNGEVVFQNQRDLESVPTYMNKLFQEHGSLSRDVIGKIYFIDTTKANTAMVDGTTSMPTGLAYTLMNDGNETVRIDANSVGSTMFGNQVEKIPEGSSLNDVVRAINPNSRIIQ